MHRHHGRPALQQSQIALAVLAGGEGSRMGRAKGELVVQGQPILQFILERLNWPGPTLLVTAPGRERPPGHELFSKELTDPIAGLGPLRGIVTAMESALAARIVFVPVDMPGVERANLDWLIAQYERLGGLGVMTRRVLNERAQIEPMPAVLESAMLPILRDRLAAGQRSLHRLAAEGVAGVVDAPPQWPESVWANLNSPEDYRTFTGS